MSLKDRIFETKGAYFFKENDDTRSLNEYLMKELIHQLHDVEDQIYGAAPHSTTPLEFTLSYRLKIENIKFRLQEIIRFIKSNEGPKIIEFVCSEVNDLMYEKIVMEISLSQDEFNDLSLIFTVMNTYFQPEIFALQIVDIDTISGDLKKAINSLLERFK